MLRARVSRRNRASGSNRAADAGIKSRAALMPQLEFRLEVATDAGTELCTGLRPGGLLPCPDSLRAASSERLRLLAASRWRVALGLTFAMMAVYFGFILLVAFDKPLLARPIVPGLSVGILLGVFVIATAWVLIAVYVVWANRHYDAAIARLQERTMTTSLGEPNASAIAGFLIFIALSLGITWWAARKTRSTEHFYAAGRSISGFQNGLALAGDYMSAASFLGIAGLVSLSGFDGLIYSIGFLVGWPVVLFLIAEPLRNLGKYTFTDVVALRLRQGPVRVAAAAGSLAVVIFYLIAQMVGAGNLVRLLFGLDYSVAIVIVGAVMLAYVLFGGMLATTWVQIVKAVLLMTGALILALLVLARFSFNPLALFAAAADQYGAGVLGPGRLVSDPLDAVSLGLALMFGTAGLPHILMRFYTVPDAATARVSVNYATGFIGAFYLLTFILGFGAMVIVGQGPIRAVDPGGNMAAPLLAEAVGGQAFLGFIAAVAFATILAVVAGLTLAGAAALSHDLWVNVVRHGSAQRTRAAARRAALDRAPRHPLDRARHRVQGPECRVHGGAGVRHRGKRELPRARPLDLLAALHHPRGAAQHVCRHRVEPAPHRALTRHHGRPAATTRRHRAPEEPGDHLDPVVFCGRDHHHHAPAGTGVGAQVRGGGGTGAFGREDLRPDRPARGCEAGASPRAVCRHAKRQRSVDTFCAGRGAKRGWRLLAKRRADGRRGRR